MSVNAVILAAGQGKRMHSDLPKVLHPLGGQPLAAHVISAVRSLKPARICVVYGHGGKRVRETLAADDLTFVEQVPQLGTGHALMQALPHLDARRDTLLLFGDVPLIGPQTLQALATAKRECLKVLTAELSDPYGYGRVVRNKKGAVVAIVEEKDATPTQRRIREINTGIMLFPAKRIAGWLSRLSNRNAQREYYLTDVIAFAVKDRVRIESCAPTHEHEILGVNSRLQLAQLERIYQRRLAAVLCESGVSVADPNRIDIRGDLSCGRDVQIDVNCVFEGTVELGDRAQIGANCVIRNTKIGADTWLAPFSVIDGADIGRNCRIGPYARMRPETRIADDVHIGNFVEVKASTVGVGSKANHLSYVGDTTVGRNVNIGAGTITCNYDGAYKHRTVIEDDVHIGSDVQLVAPVTISKGATVGAGTTVWKDTGRSGLVINPKSQQHRSDWQRPVKKASNKGGK